jgi:hypothetical protein
MRRHGLLRLLAPLLASLGAVAASGQQTIRVEPPDGVTTGLVEPFALRDSLVWYQQVYGASLFPGPVEIRSLTFFPAYPTTRISQGPYRVALTTTSRPVDGLGTSWIANRGPDHRVVFDGVLGGPITAPFVLAISPFGYDPAAGNLLLEVEYGWGAEDGWGAFLAAGGNFAGLSSRAFWFAPSSKPPLADPGVGLVTEFEVAPTACADGIDNDGDGSVDHPGDDGCESRADRFEEPRCSDGLDNDDDALADFPADPGCDGPDDPTEVPPTVCGWEDQPVTLAAGDLLVAGFAGPGETNAGLYRVEASTGDRTLVSGPGRGEGPDLFYPYGIVVESPRSVLVSDNVAYRIVRVDPSDGSRELLSGDGRGAGPVLEQPTDMVRLPSGDLAVVAYPALIPQLLRVDPITGDRDAIVPRGTTAPLSLVPDRIDLASDGRVWLWDGKSWLAWRVDLGTGQVLTSLDLFDWGNGWPLGTVNGTVVEASGTLLVSDGSVVEIDPVSGFRTLVSGSSRGSGPAARFRHLDAEASGALVAPGNEPGEVFRIDRASGDRFLVSGVQRGCGPLAPFQSIAVVRATDLSSDCSDGIDNDRDGLVDGFDPGCDDASDPSERAAGLACDDGRDDDGHLDGWDHPDDPGCAHAGDTTEAPECQDGVDNDGAPGTDFDGGASVRGAAGADPAGADPQCAGRAWWRSEAGARGCGLGFEAAVVLAVLLRWRGRSAPGPG